MKSRSAKTATSNETRTEAKRPRFRIEKLEERIAPSKGGIPGSPDQGDDQLHCFGRGKYKGCLT